MNHSPSKTLVVCPAYAAIEPECEQALAQLERAGYCVWRRWGGSAIDRVRCEIATDALKTDAEALVWIDADIGFNPTDVVRLCNHGKPWVCGVYPRKSPGGGISAHITAPRVIFGEGGGLLPIDSAGFGFMYTARELFEAIDAPEVSCDERSLRPFFLPMVRDGHYLTEDTAFCARARDAGYTLLADTTIRLCHVGRYRYWIEDAGSKLARGKSCVAELAH